ncbi:MULTISPECIES: sensor histidine kinase [Bifidobacterium]|uniref:sensor histidine kinase n=1 Tax=Bifidobacterium TaxID=1678 RepID=UPI001BDC742C|nr:MULTISPECIES: histidine kinase [Bifidobacterium]MBT1162716.1 ATP-binding protein [Bifidobacterium sp. SO1]MBW3079378.1 ATP-binding protein [Bifidobacterium simiiventris]
MNGKPVPALTAITNVPRRLALCWRSDPAARVVVPAVCLCYDVMMVTRVVFAGPDAGPHAGMLLRQSWGLPVLIALCAISIGALLARLRHPFIAVCVTCVTYLCAALFQVQAYMALPVLFALYSCVVFCCMPYLIGGVCVNAAVLALGWLLPFRAPSDAWAMFLLPMAFLESVAIALGLCSRGIRERRGAIEEIERQRRHALELERQRDMERRRTDIAAELHDSVGHDLTAIIALTEGLEGVSGDPQIEEAIAMVNELARSGLADTRQAVRALQSCGEETAEDAGYGRMRTWNDVTPILQHARRSGFIVAHTETGRRPDDEAQADLCFAVTREAVTNAIRHGHDLHRIVVSWDHANGGTLTVTVRNDGSTRDDSTAGDGSEHADDGTGMGLHRLNHLITAAGGSLEAGPDDAGYTLKAVIPSMKPANGTDNGRDKSADGIKSATKTKEQQS